MISAIISTMHHRHIQALFSVRLTVPIAGFGTFPHLLMDVTFSKLSVTCSIASSFIEFTTAKRASLYHHSSLVLLYVLKSRPSNDNLNSWSVLATQGHKRTRTHARTHTHTHTHMDTTTNYITILTSGTTQ